MFKNKTLLITGGTGFIGTNLCNELCSRGYKVIACDFYNTEREDYIRCDVRNYCLNKIIQRLKR